MIILLWHDLLAAVYGIAGPAGETIDLTADVGFHLTQEKLQEHTDQQDRLYWTDFIVPKLLYHIDIIKILSLETNFSVEFDVLIW